MERRSVRGPGLRITAIPTPHTAGHHSYRIDWHGRSLYVTGDTESTEALARQSGIDWLFVTPWLVESLGPAGLEAVADRVVVYHREVGRTIDGCPACIVLERGDPVPFVP